MAEKREAQSVPALREADLMAVVATASEAQAGKVRAILERFEQLAELDPRKVQNISSLLSAAKADGGCGIGCW
jgi:hypothetical protein